MSVREQQEGAVREREERVAQKLAFLGGSLRHASVLRFIHSDEMRTDAFSELQRVGRTCGEPGVKEGTEAPFPCLHVGELTGMNQIYEKTRGEVEDLLEQRMPGGVGTVGSPRGDNPKLLGKKGEDGRQNFGGLGLDIAMSGRGSVFRCTCFLQSPEGSLSEGTDLASDNFINM